MFSETLKEYLAARAVWKFLYQERDPLFIFFKHSSNSELCRVPAVYLTLANSLFVAFLAFSEINKLNAIK